MISELINLGLTEGEAKVYIALLKTGQSTIGAVVKESGISHSKIYDVLNRLIEKGLVSYITKEKTKYFSPASPAHIDEYLTIQEKELFRRKEMYKKILPALSQIQKNKLTQDAQVFIGLKGMKSAEEELLSEIDSKEPLLFFYVFDKKSIEKASRHYYQQFQFYHSKGIQLKGISTEELAKSQYHKAPSFMEMRFVKTPLPANINIYANKVLLHCWQEIPYAYLITSNELSQQMRKYFQKLWDRATN